MRLWTAFRNDVRLQYRYGFYVAYAFIIGMYLVLLHSLPASIRLDALALLVYSEASVIGFFFAGALIMLETSEGTLAATAVSPLRRWEYLVAKAASLSLLTVGAVVVLVVGTVGLAFRPLPLVVSAALTSALFVLLAVVVAQRFSSISRFAVWGGLANAVLGLPVLAYVGVVESPAWWTVPTWGALVLLQDVFASAPAPTPGVSWTSWGATAGLLGWAGAFLLVARRSLAPTSGVARPRDASTDAPTDAPTSELERGDPDASPSAPRRHPAAWIESVAPRWVRLAVADLRNVARDPLMLLVGGVPLGLALAVRFGFPWAADAAAGSIDLYAYADVVVGFLLILTPLMLGFVVGLLLLDERDDGILTAVSVTPLGKDGFLRFRVLTPVAWSILLGVVVVEITGLVPISWGRLLALAMLAGLEAPLLTLFLAAMASNKVEGMALSKVGSVVIGAALVALAVPAPWQWIAGLIPQFWPLRLMLDRSLPALPYAGLVTLATLVHLAALWVLLRLFLRRTE